MTDFAGGTSKPRRLEDVQQYFRSEGYTVHHGTISDGDVLVGTIQPLGNGFGFYPFEEGGEAAKRAIGVAIEYSMPVVNGYERRIDSNGL